MARTPDATAVIFEGVRLSYAELNQRANRLARYLVSVGALVARLLAQMGIKISLKRFVANPTVRAIDRFLDQ